jgi:hypothetical protein
MSEKNEDKLTTTIDICIAIIIPLRDDFAISAA